MQEPNYANNRETIWGINRSDRRWFQLITLLGGIIGSIILTRLWLTHHAASVAPSQAALNITVGIGASFVASGFIAWGLLQIKEILMAIADWIRERTAKNREKWLREAREQGIKQGVAQGIEMGREQGVAQGIEIGREQGVAQGRFDGLREGYAMGYTDAKNGPPRQTPPSGAS